MTWLYGVAGIVVGLAIGWAMHAHVSRAIEAENRELREYLRFLRNAPQAYLPTRRELARQIDKLLGDEAG